MSSVKITNRFLENVIWNITSACDFVAGDYIDVWKINISLNLSLIDDFLAIMTPAEIARANRYFQLKDKNRYIISRGALKNILSKYLNQLPTSIQFGESPDKKPYITNSGKTKLHYNMSHSGDWILLAIANTEVGTDVEEINVDFHYDDVAAESFNPAEFVFFKETKSTDHFYMLWTRKEALLKATGKGLDDNLKLIPSLDGIHTVQSHIIASEKDWLTCSFYVNEQYIASVTGNNLTGKTRFWDADILNNKNIF